MIYLFVMTGHSHYNLSLLRHNGEQISCNYKKILWNITVYNNKSINVVSAKNKYE